MAYRDSSSTTYTIDDDTIQYRNCDTTNGAKKLFASHMTTESPDASTQMLASDAGHQGQTVSFQESSNQKRYNCHLRQSKCRKSHSTTPKNFTTGVERLTSLRVSLFGTFHPKHLKTLIFLLNVANKFRQVECRKSCFL